jgi:hypothetical protein
MNKTNRDFYTLITLLMGLIALQVILKGKLLSNSQDQQANSHFEVPVTDSTYNDTREPGTTKTTTFIEKDFSGVSTLPEINLSSLSGRAVVESPKK